MFLILSNLVFAFFPEQGGKITQIDQIMTGTTADEIVFRTRSGNYYGILKIEPMYKEIVAMLYLAYAKKASVNVVGFDSTRTSNFGFSYHKLMRLWIHNSW